MSAGEVLGAHLKAGDLGRFIPEPRSRVAGFGSLMEKVGSALKSTAQTVVSLDPAYQALLEKQIEVQTQMQVVSMESNIEKSKHETQMSAIRNIRVG